MTKQMTSGALSFMDRALNLFGHGSQEQFLDDGHVSQVIDINRITGQSLGLGPDQGIVSSSLFNTHAAAGDVQQTMDPYNPGVRGGAMASLPAAVPFRELDAWLIFACAFVDTGATLTVDNVEIGFLPGAALFGISEGASTVTVMPLMRWDAVIARVFAEGVDTMANSASGTTGWIPQPFRWPRTGSLEFASQVSGAGAATIRLSTLWAFVRQGLAPTTFP